MQNNYTQHKLFVCVCNSLDHQLIISKISGDEDIYVTVGLIEDLHFFKRLWVALRYLFGRNDPQVEIILSPEKTKSLVDILSRGV